MMTGSLAAASKKSKYLVTISPDNRVHLLDTDTKSEKRSYVEKDHLSHSYACFDWWQKSSDNLGLFVLGCSDGKVLVWDFARGIVVHNIANGLSPITSVVFSNNSSYLYVSDEGNYVNQYKLGESGVNSAIKVGKKGVQKICMNPKVDVLAVASSSIKLIDINTGKKKKLDIKLPGTVTGLCYSQCGCYLAVSLKDTQEIMIFDIQSSSSTSDPICVVSTIGQPVNIDMRSSDYYIEILCWFTHTDACLIRKIINLPPNKSKNKKSTTPSITELPIYISNIYTNNPVICGCLGKPGSGLSIGATLMIGSVTTPQYEYIEYDTNLETYQIVEEITLQSHPTHSASSASSSSSSSKNANKNSSSTNGIDVSNSVSDNLPTTILGPYDSDSRKRPILDKNLDNLLDKDTPIKTKKARSMSDGENSEVDQSITTITQKNNKISQQTSSSHSQQYHEIHELSIEQRLEMLSKSFDIVDTKHSKDKEVYTDKMITQTTALMNQNKELSMNGKVATTTTTTISSTTNVISNTENITLTNSLVVLLEQALQSRDDHLLEQCLDCHDKMIIETTCQYLSTVKIIPFLMKLTGKLEKKPSRGSTLTIWLSYILKYHASYLIAFPGINKYLIGLSQMLEYRVHTYTKLTSLCGRMDLIMHQSTHAMASSSSSSSSSSAVVSSTRMDSTSSTSTLKNTQPKAVYYEE